MCPFNESFVLEVFNEVDVCFCHHDGIKEEFIYILNWGIVSKSRYKLLSLKNSFQNKGKIIERNGLIWYCFIRRNFSRKYCQNSDNLFGKKKIYLYI